MKYRDLLMVESQSQVLPATPENIAAAKRFVFHKWQERARELGRDDPIDLADACKFTSLFAARVFNGTLRGNFFHQWVELPDGKTLDLNDEAADVIAMLRGEVPQGSRAYADMMRKRLPTPLYTHDAGHMRRGDNRQSMASVQPRVDRWIAEFLQTRSTLGEAAGQTSALYHATLTKSLPSIRREGLTPNTEREPNWDGYPINGRLYVARNEAAASFYADNLAEMYEAETVMLRFPARGLRVKADDFGNPNDGFITKSIPPERIEIRQGDQWLPLSSLPITPKEPIKKPRNVMFRWDDKAQDYATLDEAASKDHVEEAAWWLTRWISGSMNDPDWDDSWTTINPVQAFTILHDVVGNRQAVGKVLWRSVALLKRDVARTVQTKLLRPHRAFPYQSFSTDKQIALDMASIHQMFINRQNVLVSTQPPPDLIAFSMMDLLRSSHPAIRGVLQSLDLWHHQKEVLVRVTAPLPLLSVETIE